MKKLAAGIIMALFLLAGAVYWKYWEGYHIQPVPKPKIWGYTDPPSLANMSWKNVGSVEMIRENVSTAGALYGKTLLELQEIGYSMVSGNWSEKTCQWSYWTRGDKGYYIAYNGTAFLAIRGNNGAVLNASEENWLCGKPLDAPPMASPSPWKLAEAMAVSFANKFMKNNFTITAFNWTEPLPDWYLAKVSFKAEVGDGVEILILVYSDRDQVEYAEYLMKKADRNLEFLRNDGGDYYALIALRGNRDDVEKAVEIIQKPEK